ncbi:MAG: phosphate--acyl-ACP acyltransferase, partial [Thermodesulfovibrionales bacterium]
MKVALDAMGGDFAPEVTIAGALEAVNEYDLEVTLVGDKAVLSEALKGKRYPADRISIYHAPEVVQMNEATSTALRRKKHSSIRKAVDLVKEGAA